MKSNLVKCGLRFLLVSCLCLVTTTSLLGGTTATVPAAGELNIPVYADWSPWGRYFRRLQDSTALRWYEEITYYSKRFAYSHGVVTVRYLITPDGAFHNPQIVSNTSNQPMADAVLRALRKTWNLPFPPQIAAIAPGGLVVEQTFRYWNYDPTQYGFASSYPQLLTQLHPEDGNALFILNLRLYHNLYIFPFQSRISEIAPASVNRLALR
jgi:Gram-negative bacterial TonB protein C-terminal